MNVLFIHGNFPGQFQRIAPYLAQRVRGKTLFLTESENPQKIQLAQVKRLQFKKHREVADGCHHYLRRMEQAVINGQAILRALHALRQEGFVPDVVIAHGGMGYGMFVKALLPQTRLISYVEWFFRPETAVHLRETFEINAQCTMQMSNLPILQELEQADAIVCPTHWQRSQFPLEWQPRIQVLFDGVDVEFFQPKLEDRSLELRSGDGEMPLKLSADQRVMSYGTRGMEPLRGFPEFMRAAAAAQQRFADLQVVVCGSERVAYSYPSHHPSGSWKEALLEELDGQLDRSRLHFTGSLNYGELVQLWRRSDLHCFFTRPYVVSWGVFQAAACGTRLLVNDFPGLHEVFESPPAWPPVDLEDQKSVSAAVLAALAEPRALDAAPAANLKAGLDLASCLERWWQLIRASA